MAEAPKPDDALNAPQEKKEEKKPVGTLESIVNETFKFIWDTAKTALAVGIPATQAALVPYAARDTYILTGAQVAGDATTARRKGEKFTLTDAIKSSVVGTAITVPIYHTYNLMNKIPLDSIGGYLGRAGVFGGLVYPA